MKKLLTIAFTLLLGASLTFAQAAGGSTSGQSGSTDKSSTDTGKKGKSGKKGHKGGKKSKKNSGGDTTPPPK
jgi:hypothetical protein